MAAWATTIARNKAIDLIKQHRFTEFNDDIGTVTEAPPPSPSPKLHAAIAGLSPKKRELITLHYFKEMEMQTIAESTGMSLSNVKVTIMRARQDIKRQLEA